MDTTPTPVQLPLDADGLITHADAQALGQAHVLRSLHRSGDITRVSRGVYRAADGNRRGPRVAAEHYRQRVLAAAHRMKSPVFTSYSAAALLHLPIVDAWPEEVFVLAGAPTGSRRRGVREVAHRLEVPETLVAGIRVTAPEYTLIQLARHAGLRAALVATDAALRDLPYGESATLTTMDRLLAEDARLRPYPGARRVSAVLQRASSLADRPLESISRLAIEELGFAEPELQARFWLPRSAKYAWLDFYWPDVNIGAEADGDGKYLDAGSAASAAQRVIREKQREDELRPQLNSFLRWDWRDAWQLHRLEGLLERAGVPRTRQRRRFVVR